MSTDEVDVAVTLHMVTGIRNIHEQITVEAPSFDVNVKFEEIERRMGEGVFSMALTLTAKPNVAQYELKGEISVHGREDAFEQVLQPDPMNRVPVLLTMIYQHIFPTLYLLAGVINAPHPSPNLLLSTVKSEMVPVT
jgi:hypothetical protein